MIASGVSSAIGPSHNIKGTTASRMPSPHVRNRTEEATRLSWSGVKGYSCKKRLPTSRAAEAMIINTKKYAAPPTRCKRRGSMASTIAASPVAQANTPMTKSLTSSATSHAVQLQKKKPSVRRVSPNEVAIAKDPAMRTAVRR